MARLGQGEVLDGFGVHCRDELDERDAYGVNLLTATEFMRTLVARGVLPLGMGGNSVARGAA